MIKTNDKVCSFDYTLFWEKNNNVQQLPKYETFFDLFFNFWIFYIVEILPDKILKKRITVPCLNRPTYFSPSLCWNSPWPCGTPCFQSPTNVSPFDHLKIVGSIRIGTSNLKSVVFPMGKIFFRQRSKILRKLIESWVGEVNQTLSRAFNYYVDKMRSKKCLLWSTFRVKRSTLRWVDSQNRQKMST